MGELWCYFFLFVLHPSFFLGSLKKEDVSLAEGAFGRSTWLPGELLRARARVGRCFKACREVRLLADEVRRSEMSLLAARLWFGVECKLFHQPKLRKHLKKKKKKKLLLVSGIYCCVTNHLKLSGLRQLFIARVSVGRQLAQVSNRQEWLISASPGVGWGGLTESRGSKVAFLMGPWCPLSHRASWFFSI